MVTTLTEKVNKVETQVQDLGLALDNAATQITIGETIIETVNGELNLPLASGDVVGLVMAKVPNEPINSVNSISINDETGYLEVNSLSTDKLVQGEDTLILNCSQTF